MGYPHISSAIVRSASSDTHTGSPCAAPTGRASRAQNAASLSFWEYLLGGDDNSHIRFDLDWKEVPCDQLSSAEVDARLAAIDHMGCLRTVHVETAISAVRTFLLEFRDEDDLDVEALVRAMGPDADRLDILGVRRVWNWMFSWRLKDLASRFAGASRAPCMGFASALCWGIFWSNGSKIY
mmetsp:Transcript_39930/g.54400  ORF Transcript_39930/g.54400 Transcript_39930/m.54400 type:complete len:181 (-) Transcript_39930:182-724(-)